MDWLFLAWIVLVFVVLFTAFALLTVYRLWSEVVQMRKFVAHCAMQEDLTRMLKVLSSQQTR